MSLFALPADASVRRGWCLTQEKILYGFKLALDNFSEEKQRRHGLPEHIFNMWKMHVLEALEVHVGKLSGAQLAAAEDLQELADRGGGGGYSADVKRLHAFLHVSEADKESGRPTFSCAAHCKSELLKEVWAADAPYVAVARGATAAHALFSKGTADPTAGGPIDPGPEPPLPPSPPPTVAPVWPSGESPPPVVRANAKRRAPMPSANLVHLRLDVPAALRRAEQAALARGDCTLRLHTL